MIINTKIITQRIYSEITEILKDKSTQKVCFVLFGNNSASLQFINIKKRKALDLGIYVELVHFPEINDTESAYRIIKNISNSIDCNYDGIVIQLPLPNGIDTDKILSLVPVEQDIDVLGRESINLFRENKLHRIPPVANAVWEILQSLDIDAKKLSLLSIVLFGYGKLVGEPIGMMFDNKNINYTVCDKNTHTTEKYELLKNADVIISGVGVPHIITPDMIKTGSILIDAGTSESSGIMVGDIHPDCDTVAAYMTSVPGGVGPVTVACVYKNLVL